MIKNKGQALAWPFSFCGMNLVSVHDYYSVQRTQNHSERDKIV